VEFTAPAEFETYCSPWTRTVSATTQWQLSVTLDDEPMTAFYEAGSTYCPTSSLWDSGRAYEYVYQNGKFTTEVPAGTTLRDVTGRVGVDLFYPPVLALAGNCS